MNVTFSGFDEFNEKLSQLAKDGQIEINRFAAQEAEVILGKAKDNTPTDTGQLKNGWQRTRAKQGTVTVYNNTEYATHVEYGHRQESGRYVSAIGKRLKKDFVPGKKMLHRAMLQTGKTFRADAEAIVKGLMHD